MGTVFYQNLCLQRGGSKRTDMTMDHHIKSGRKIQGVSQKIGGSAL